MQPPFAQSSKYHKSVVSRRYLRRRLLGSFLLLAFLALASLGLLPSRGKMQESVPLHTEQAIKGVSSGPVRPVSEHTSLAVVATPVKFFQSSVGAVSLTWMTCGSCPETPEVSVSGDTISLGVANRTSSQLQGIAIHGAAAALPASSTYTITFDYDWFTFDSYSSPTEGFVGFWDAFSISVGSQPYWQLELSDPMTKSKVPGLGLIWGGPTFGTVLHHTSGSRTITVAGNSSGNNFLNVALDTRTSPFSDRNFPSWGTIKIKSIMTDSDCAALAKQAADLAATVVPSTTRPETYSYGAKGWTCSGTRRFVDPQEILLGYSHSQHTICGDARSSQSCDFVPGLDCSGLIFWSYNKSVGAMTYSTGFLQAEGSSGQCGAAASDPVHEDDLRPGDIACFPGHVAMYVGPNHFRDAIEAANCSVGINWTTKVNLKGRTGFQGFRRLKCSSQYALAVKSHSPISLVVTDPDGFTISVDTTAATNEEVLHEIPGVLYYVRDNEDGDVVFGPTLKPGVYRIKAVPKPDAQSNDTFSIEVTGAGYLLNLAQNVSIANIPPEGYNIRSTGDEIIPVNPNLTPTITALSSDINPAKVGEVVTFTATLDSGSGTPSGNVAFKDSGNVVATVPLNSNGIATLATDSLAPGEHSMSAEYLGDGITFSGSTSNTILQQIKQEPDVQLADLINAVTSSNLVPEGIQTSLTAKLNAARIALEAGDVSTACSKLQDFIHEVKAQRGKKLLIALADSFTSVATQIKGDLGCDQLASGANQGKHKDNAATAAFQHSVYTLIILFSSLGLLLGITLIAPRRG